MKKIVYSIIAILSFVGIAYAQTAGIPITVPSAPSAGYWLVSTSTGRYLASSTNPIFVGSIFSTSTTATSTFAGGVSASNISAGTLASNIAPDLVTPNWTLGTGWNYATSPNAIQKTGGGSGSAQPATALTIVAGQEYQVIITVATITQTANYSLGGTAGTSLSAATTYTDYITAANTNNFIITTVGMTRIKITSITITPITGLGTMTAYTSLATPKILSITGNGGIAIATSGALTVGDLSATTLTASGAVKGTSLTATGLTAYGIPYVSSTGQLATMGGGYSFNPTGNYFNVFYIKGYQADFASALTADSLEANSYIYYPDGNILEDPSSNLYYDDNGSARGDQFTDTNGNLYLSSASGSGQIVDADGNHGLSGQCLVMNADWNADGYPVWNTCTTPSSEKYKRDIQVLTATSSLNEIMALQPVSFTYKSDLNGVNKNTGKNNPLDPTERGQQVGLIAEQVLKVDPSLVNLTTATTTFEGITYPPGTPDSVRYDKAVAQLVGAVQAQQNEISYLQSEITLLQAKLK